MLDKEAIGRRIAFFRREKGMTQKELADNLHISYQAVSKWESGKSLPTIELLYEISLLLNMTVDALLDEDGWKNRRITYRDSGLDTKSLHDLKKQIQKLNTEDGRILSAEYADAALFQLDTSQMKDPVYACITCVPGSKGKLAREYRYDQQICADTAANAMNFILQHGLRPAVLKVMVVCGNYDQEQLYLMAQAFREICDKNQVSFTGMEISAQPVNHGPEEYEVVATVIGVQDRDKLLTGEQVQEGDILIGIRTEGIEGTVYPIVKVMMDKKPGLFHAKIDEETFFLDELLKANLPFTREIAALQEKGYLHDAYRIGHSLLGQKMWWNMPEGLGICIDLPSVPVLPLYQFLYEQDLIGENVFPYHFNMGIGMAVVVPERCRQDAMRVIGQYSECCQIGQVEKNTQRKGEKVWSTGRILWRG